MSKGYVSNDFEKPPQNLISAYYAGLSKVWLPAIRLDDLNEGQSKAITLAGQEILLAKLDDNIVAMPNYCAHFQARLSDGTVERLCNKFERVVRCRYHGWAFNHKGECVEIPQLEEGQAIPKSAHLAPYKTQIEHGLVWVSLNETPNDPIPTFPETMKADMVSTPTQYSTPWKGSMIRMVLSVLDDYHFPWLHEGVLGTRDKPMPPKRKITFQGNELKSQFETFQPSNVTNAINEGKDGSIVQYQMIVNMPNIIRIVKQNEDGGLYVVQFFPQPISYNETALFWKVSRNYDITPEGEKKIIDMERFIQSQDMEHVGLQRPWLMKPAPIKGADDALVAYMAGLKKYGLSPRI